MKARCGWQEMAVDRRHRGNPEWIVTSVPSAAARRNDRLLSYPLAIEVTPAACVRRHMLACSHLPCQRCSRGPAVICERASPSPDDPVGTTRGLLPAAVGFFCSRRPHRHPPFSAGIVLTLRPGRLQALRSAHGTGQSCCACRDYEQDNRLGCVCRGAWWVRGRTDRVTGSPPSCSVQATQATRHNATKHAQRGPPSQAMHSDH